MSRSLNRTRASASRALWRAITVAATLAAAGCASLAPSVPDPQPDIPQEWPIPASTVGMADAPPNPGATASMTAVLAADIGWRDFFVDPALTTLIARALDSNRDLRTALINVERARGLYRVQRANQYPTVGVGAIAQRSGGGDLPMPSNYSVSLGLSSFELDFFGRVRDLSRAALQQFFAEEENRRVVQLTIIADVASAWLALAADQALLQVAQATLANQSDAYRLTERRHELGAVSALDLNQQRTTVESARADVARYAGQVATDTNALTVLVGAPIEPDLLPKNFDVAATTVRELPAGLPSEVLLRRPDIRAAENRLRSANANIGAARAAFFPSITLTASAGTASTALSGLFGGGSFSWALIPQLNLPIFDPGRLRGNLQVAQADQDIALSEYERTIQVGFREVSDALALTHTLAQQRVAQLELVAAATRANDLSLARYKAGRDSYLTQLVAERTRYVAQQSLIETRLAEQRNRVTLYRVLGGGWFEYTR
jgi:multidrug efflux system outer membrane protein